MSQRSRILAFALCAATPLIIGAATADKPSRKAFKDCRWEKLTDANVGLDAWVMRCSYGSQKIDFAMSGHTLTMRTTGEKPQPVVEVIDLQPGETAKQGIRRFFDARTDKTLARRCLLAPFDGGKEKLPPGVTRYTFVADATLKKELDAKAVPGDIPDPPCGEWGDQPDFIQYFEVHEGARRVLFVNVGQDDPLYDEKTLRILPLK